MAVAQRDLLHVPAGYRSGEAASFVEQLDTLTRYLKHDLRGITRRELEWQPAPGMNSIGMLLAHIAIVEIWWIGTGLRRIPAPQVDFVGQIGIRKTDDGIPAKRRGGHPAALAGWAWSDYQRLLNRARARVRAVARTVTERSMGTPARRTRLDGKVQVFNNRWVLFHMVEHFAGHYGQILMLRHAYRARGRRR